MNASQPSKILAIACLLALSSCKSVSGGETRLAGDSSSERPETKRILFDVNDVSILVPRPEKGVAAKGYLKFSDQTSEGPLLSEKMFAQTAAMGQIVERNYAVWAMAGMRIDNCAKLLLPMPCEVQIRLVFQPLEESGGFGDEAIHLPFNVDSASALTLYKDFIELKKSALPHTTVGPLGVHPILLKEGMDGPFAARLKKLILKHSRPSHFERIAAMGTKVTGKSASWFFAASLPVKDETIIASPIPCQAGEKLNTFTSLTIDGMLPTMPRRFRASVEPAPSNCGQLDVTKLIVQSNPRKVTLEGEEWTQEANNALAINDPSKVFFASTTCVNCHLAGRRLGMANGMEFLSLVDGNPFRYKAPGDVTTTYSEKSSQAGSNTWNIRAFGWNDTGDDPAISLYTFNDTMRVAHELNDLIRAGKLD